MICKNCSAEYDDSYSFCPKCGKENTEKFTVSIPEYPEYSEYPGYNEPMEYTDISSFSDNDGSVAIENREEDESAAHTYEAADDSEAYGDDSDVKAYDNRIEDEQSADEQQEEPEHICPQYGEENSESVTAEPEQPSESAEAAEALPKKRRPLRRVPATNRKEENKTVAAIIAVMCVVAVLAGALSALKISTDTLETTEPAEKVVATIGLSAQEEVMLEEVLARCFSVLRTDYNSELSDAEAFLEKVNPYDKGGVYSMIYNEYPAVQTEADPALRFYNEEESYAYYKIEESKIDDLMSIFGIDAHHAVNTKNCYYYDGCYYFAPVVQKMTFPVKAEITKSKRVLDGSYYSELYFYAESGEKRVETDTYYLVTEKTGDGQTGEIFFKIKKISTTPIFDDSGKLVESKNYKIKKQVIEGKTDDGKVYCRYIFEYPVFTGDSIGYQSINDFFSTAVTAYKLRADSAQKSYESFIKQGGKDSDLPITETVIARVSYEDEKYISIVEKNGIDEPVLAQNVAVTTQSEDEEYNQDEEQTEDAQTSGVTLFKRLVDGYVFDKATGEFVSKDVLAGKDYLAVSEILYRIYNSYEYESIIPEAKTEAVTDEYGEVVEEEESDEDEDYYYYDDDEIPDDNDGFGTVIYESACAFTQTGLTFYYVNGYGLVEEVTIPYAVVERLAQS